MAYIHYAKGKTQTEGTTMKQQKISKEAKAYLNRIEACADRNEIEGIRIAFSQDCSANKLSWEDFMILFKAQQAKRKEIRAK